MRIPTISTPRLILRPFTVEDVAALQRILSEKDVLRYFPQTKPPAPARLQKMIVDQLKHWEKHSYGLWAVELRSKSGLIGRSGLQYLSETGEVEVDYLLAKAFWGKGLATEAAQTSIQYGFGELGFTRIVGIVHPENKASQRVLEKLGMSFVEQAQYFGLKCHRYVIERSSYGNVAPSSDISSRLGFSNP